MRIKTSTLQEQRQERNDENQKYRDDATPDPIEHRNEIIAPRLPTDHVALRIYSTDSQLLVECSDEKH